MNEPKAVRLIRGLKTSELRGFFQYASCELFNQNPRLVALAGYLQELPAAGETEDLSHDRLARVAFPEANSVDPQKLHDQLAQLARLAESYLAWLHFSRDQRAQSLHLLGHLTHRKEEDLFQKTLRRVNIEPEKANRDEASRLFAFQVAESEMLYQRRSHRREADPASDAGFLDMVQRLDRYYLFSKLKFACEILNRRQVVNTGLALDLVPEIEAYLTRETHVRAQDPGLDIYYHILLTLRPDHEEGVYQRLLELLDRNKELFPKSEQQAMYTFAQNYCIRRVNAGDAGFLEQLFLLYQRLLDQEVLLDEGELAHWHYKNIATVGLRLRRFEWVADFLEKFKPLVPKADRENAFNYTLSSYYYELGQYKDALRLLQQVEFTDVFYHLSAKSVLLKIYFEQDDSDGLGYLTHAFQGLLRRSRHLTGAHVDNYQNLIRFVKKADRLRRRRPLMDAESYALRLAELTEAVKATPGMVNKSWLLLRLQEMAGVSAS